MFILELVYSICHYQHYFDFYRNYSLLSFGEEAEEDEEMVNQVSQVLKYENRVFAGGHLICSAIILTFF